MEMMVTFINFGQGFSKNKEVVFSDIPIATIFYKEPCSKTPDRVN